MTSRVFSFVRSLRFARSCLSNSLSHEAERLTASRIPYDEADMTIEMNPIGHVETTAEKIPRSWRSSDLVGDLVICEEYAEGISEVEAGDRIVVIFNFHESPPFSRGFLRQNPRSSGGEERGVFKTLSPVRPNPIGMSIVEVVRVEGTTLRVCGLDMRDGTPILDMKPWRGDLPGVPVFEG